MQEGSYNSILETKANYMYYMKLTESNTSTLTEKNQMTRSPKAGETHKCLCSHIKKTTLCNSTHHRHLPPVVYLTSYTQIKMSLCPCIWVPQRAIEVWSQAGGQPSPTMPLLEIQAVYMPSLGQLLSNWNTCTFWMIQESSAVFVNDIMVLSENEREI